jgi:hypothetical protein
MKEKREMGRFGSRSSGYVQIVLHQFGTILGTLSVRRKGLDNEV